MPSDYRRIIDRLGLAPHPEGGWFRETYRSASITSIYYLLAGDAFSAFHRLASDEIWHHYEGAPVTIDIIAPGGMARSLVLDAHERRQAAVEAGSWFAAHICNTDAYALVGCDVAPPFVFERFELADRERLAAEFPQHRALVERWTRLRPDAGLSRDRTS